MQSLALILLLAISAAAEQTGDRRSPAIAAHPAHRTLAPRMAMSDPCRIAREIARQPACLATGDCEALRVWRRAFGPPRLELLDPDRRPDLSLAAGRRLTPGPSTSFPAPRPLLRPGVVCPAGADTPR